MDKKTEQEAARKNTRVAAIVFATVIIMIGVSFASVPLYNLFCRVTGFGGTVQRSEQLPENVLERTVTINFNADISPKLPWVFKPEERSITVKLGQRGITSFMSENKTDKPTSGMAIYNVTPAKAGKYFHKIECFCFSEQTLAPHQKADMPVLFFVDPKMNEDPNMDDIKTITLSYSFYPADSNELEQAMEEFYNE